MGKFFLLLLLIIGISVIVTIIMLIYDDIKYKNYFKNMTDNYRIHKLFIDDKYYYYYDIQLKNGKWIPIDIKSIYNYKESDENLEYPNIKLSRPETYLDINLRKKVYFTSEDEAIFELKHALNKLDAYKEKLYRAKTIPKDEIFEIKINKI